MIGVWTEYSTSRGGSSIENHIRCPDAHTTPRKIIEAYNPHKHIDLTHKISPMRPANTDRLFHRSSPRIPSDRASPAHGRQPDAQAVPHAHLRPERRGGQVPLLVLPDEAAQGQEVVRRDRVVERHPREATAQGQELWHLDPIRLPLRHPQHVQGVPRDEPHRCRRSPVPGYGRQTSCPIQEHPRMDPLPNTLR